MFSLEVINQILHLSLEVLHNQEARNREPIHSREVHKIVKVLAVREARVLQDQITIVIHHQEAALRLEEVLEVVVLVAEAQVEVLEEEEVDFNSYFKNCY